MVNRNQHPEEGELKRLEKDLLDQYAFEKWWIEDIKAHDVEHNMVLRERGQAINDKGIRSIVTNLAERLGFEIDEQIDSYYSGGNNRRSVKVIKTVLKDIQSFELAYLILTTAVNALLSNHQGFITVAAMSSILANALEDEFRFRAMVAMEPNLPKMVDRVLKESRASLKHRRRVFVYKFHKRAGAKIPPVFHSIDSRIEVGNALVELLFTPPGIQLMKVERAYDVNKRDVRWVIKPSETLREIFYRDMDIEALAKHTLPLGILLYEPNKRVYGLSEMLLTNDTPPVRFNRLAGKKADTFQALRENNCGYDTLLETLTYLEKTPLKINEWMLRFIEQHFEELQRAGILAKASLELPDCPFDKAHEPKDVEEEAKLKEWKAHVEKKHNSYWKDRLKVIKQTRMLSLARKLSEYPAFYYRWYADFRGRLYPLNTILSLQGNSVAKALLEFGETSMIKPGDAEDTAWVEFIEYGLRLKSCYKNETIEAIVEWCADKDFIEYQIAEFRELSIEEIIVNGVKPKDFLPYAAWIGELSRLFTQWGSTCSTRHPIRKDACCSSMQHMAALSGDVNVLTLTNCDGAVTKPNDLYTQIVPEFQSLELERDWIKTFVMTYAYNSTDYGRRKDLETVYEERYGMALDRKKGQDIQDRLKEAVAEGLGKVLDLQAAFNEVFYQMVRKGGQPALSCTITDWVVDSTKYEFPTRRYWLYNMNAKFQIRMRDVEAEDAPMNLKKMRQGWVANVIHSMDAALLHILISCLYNIKKQRLALVPIHDCVTTLPGQMATIVKGLELGFKALYSPNDVTGMPEALHRLVDFWDLEADHPALYDKFTEFQAVDPEMFTDMRYFFK